MRLRALIWSMLISAATMAASTVPAAVPAKGCMAGGPAAASHARSSRHEASVLLRDVQADAQRAVLHASTLQSFEFSPDLHWQTHATELDHLKNEIDGIGASLCQLETLRSTATPWQQHAIDQIAKDTRLMADNDQDAILFLNVRHSGFWRPTYEKYVDNLYSEAESVTHSAGNALDFSSVSKEHRDLEHKLGTRSAS
jgi:hypothetical protein